MSHQHHRYHQARNITLIGAAVNALLGVMKVLGGVFLFPCFDRGRITFLCRSIHRYYGGICL